MYNLQTGSGSINGDFSTETRRGWNFNFVHQRIKGFLPFKTRETLTLSSGVLAARGKLYNIFTENRGYRRTGTRNFYFLFSEIRVPTVFRR